MEAERVLCFLKSFFFFFFFVTKKIRERAQKKNTTPFYPLYLFVCLCAIHNTERDCFDVDLGIRKKTLGALGGERWGDEINKRNAVFRFFCEEERKKT